MIFTVYRLELFKLLKRPAAWVTYLSFLVLTVLISVAQRNGAPPAHGRGFSDTLPAILTGDPSLASTFAVVLIVLMTCSEFDWKTSRQNIIDGLSKPQWFAGKALLLPTVASVLYLTRFAVGATLALFAASIAHPQPYDPALTYILAASAVLLGMLCYAGIALLICLTVRSAGPALAAVLIYQVFDNIAAAILRSHRLGDIAEWLPLQLQSALGAYQQYQPHIISAHKQLAGHSHTGLLFVAAAAWVVVLLGVSYRVYLKRDL